MEWHDADGVIRAPEIAFTGFHPAHKSELTAAARRFGFRVRATVTQRLDFLCTGATPGPVKMAKAREVGAKIIPPSAFVALLQEAAQASKGTATQR